MSAVLHVGRRHGRSEILRMVDDVIRPAAMPFLKLLDSREVVQFDLDDPTSTIVSPFHGVAYFELMKHDVVVTVTPPRYGTIETCQALHASLRHSNKEPVPRVPRHDALTSSTNTPPNMQVYPAAQQITPVSPAAQHIGQVSELVAAIVEQIECATDLARAQQVSQTWNYEIARSRLCQERLFRVPVTEYELVSAVVTDDARISGFRNVLSRVPASTERQDPDEVVVVVHPLLDSSRSCYWAGGDVDFDKLLTWPPGPWEDMYITQPTSNNARLTVHYTFNDGPYLHEPMTVMSETFINSGENVDFRRIVKELKATCYVSDSEFWTWLPEAYHLEARGKPKIFLDDYIASYAFPRPVKATIELRWHISSTSEKYLRLRKQSLRPHPGERQDNSEV